MAVITTTQLSNSIPTIVAAEALGYLKSNTVLAQLVNRDYNDEVASYGKTINITSVGSLSVNDKAEGSVVTAQAPSDSKVSVTLNKHKEVTFTIEDIAAAFSRPDHVSKLVAQAMAKLVEQVDSDIAALYSGFSQTIDATSGLAEDDFREARRLLNSAKAPLLNRNYVLHEDAEFELLAIEKFVNRDYAELNGAPAGLLNAYAGSFMGFNIFMDQNMSVVSGSPNTIKNLAFQTDAIVLASRPLPVAPGGMGVLQTVMNEDGLAIRVTMSYDSDYLGAKFTIDTLYGVAELRDNHAVVVTTNEI